MKKMTSAAIMLMMLSKTSFASTIAVVDSGNDFKHKDLAQKAWINPLEIAENDRDEDRNGYQDDIYGWNFAESNNQLIDYSYARTLTADAKRFFEIQLKSFLGTLTEEDRTWYKEKIKDPEFIKNLSLFGNWMHGTHVQGITLKHAPEGKVVGMKLIPTEVKLPGKNSMFISTKNQRSEQFVFNNEDKKSTPIRDNLLMAALSTLAKQQSTVFSEIGSYANNVKADVLNGSFGTPYSAIEGIVKVIFEKMYKRAPTDVELKKFTTYFFSIQLEETKKFLNAAPNTLFIFAAGNEGTNNDEYPTSPANVQGENKLTVAATLQNQAIAVFSNYGSTNVDVAAPGVGIMSTIPMDQHMAVSGTSQAAPYVASVAAGIKDINPRLSALDIKRIIMQTVDVKGWLNGKVKSSGVVNKERAFRAAELSKAMTLKESISKSKVDILDVETPVYFGVQSNLELILPMPNPINLKID